MKILKQKNRQSSCLLLLAFLLAHSI
ncbi:hypothetical protein [Acetobacter tropicalis]